MNTENAKDLRQEYLTIINSFENTKCIIDCQIEQFKRKIKEIEEEKSKGVYVRNNSESVIFVGETKIEKYMLKKELLTKVSESDLINLYNENRITDITKEEMDAEKAKKALDLLKSSHLAVPVNVYGVKDIRDIRDIVEKKYPPSIDVGTGSGGGVFDDIKKENENETLTFIDIENVKKALNESAKNETLKDSDKIPVNKFRKLKRPKSNSIKSNTFKKSLKRAK